MVGFMKWQRHPFVEVVSTNQTALAFPIGSVIIAETQSGGRGRMGRVWCSPPGNLYLSAVVSDYGPRTPLLALVAGVAVAQALASFGVCLKWPNDVLLHGGKVAGILLEGTGDGRVIIGIGVNVVSHPSRAMMYQTADLGGRLTRDAVADLILDRLSVNLDLFATRGFEPLRREWVSLAAGLGQTMTVHTPRGTVSGTFKDLSPQGELILETPDKSVQKITAGDVFLYKDKNERTTK